MVSPITRTDKSNQERVMVTPLPASNPPQHFLTFMHLYNLLTSTKGYCFMQFRPDTPAAEKIIFTAKFTIISPGPNVIADDNQTHHL